MEVNPCAIVRVFLFKEALDNVCGTIIIRDFYLLQIEETIGYHLFVIYASKLN